MNNYIPRDITPALLGALKHFSVIVLTGPRQVGKTTLCRNILSHYTYANLEDTALREQALLDPKRFIAAAEHGLIIDEAHTCPELLPYIQIAADNNPDWRFVITGSSNFQLLQRVTESLAGRAALFTLMPLALSELAPFITDTSDDTLMLKGTYPAVWTKQQPSRLVYQNYYTTYVERDVRQLLNIGNITTFQRFIRLSAGRVATEFNASAISNNIGVSVKTVQAWLSVLQASYIVFAMPPFYENIGKRLVKTPKLFFYDTGLLCFLLGIENEQQLALHPLRGAVFENMIACEMYKQAYNNAQVPQIFFYRDKSQHEVDILTCHGYQYEAYEVKSSTTFNAEYTRNLTYLAGLLGERLTRTAVVYAGQTGYDTDTCAVLNYRDFLTNRRQS